MQKFNIKTSVNKGKIIEHQNLLNDALTVFEGKEILITVERFYKKRSNKQNRYYWGVIIEHWKNIIRQEWGEIWTIDEVHDFLKANLNFQVFVDEGTGELAVNPVTNEVIKKPKSTKENTTYSQEEYHKSCRDLAFEMFGYIIPEPEPNEDLEQPIDVDFN